MTLNEQGYYFPRNQADKYVLRRLKQKEIMSLHLANIKNHWICYLEGKNDMAMKAFIEHYRINYLSSHKLAQIKKFLV